mmetsp:Transcript_4131/g.13579  ORF Transcript_4131/g.13579 Transcript_4131/m.13579 type:complete len:231 (-) Transcript_4131:3486-4178(-)
MPVQATARVVCADERHRGQAARREARTRRPVSASKSRKWLSLQAVTAYLFDTKRTDTTASEWPLRVLAFQSAEFHIRAVPSADADASERADPSPGFSGPHWTSFTASRCVRVSLVCRRSRSTTFNVPSSEPAAISGSDGCAATLSTALRNPFRVKAAGPRGTDSTFEGGRWPFVPRVVTSSTSFSSSSTRRSSRRIDVHLRSKFCAASEAPADDSTPLSRRNASAVSGSP